MTTKKRKQQPPVARKKKFPIVIWIALIVTALIIVTRLHLEISGKQKKVSEAVSAFDKATTRDALKALREFGEAYQDGTHHIRETGQRTICDDHEHIGSMKEMPDVLAAMDRLNIKQMVLLGSPMCTLTLNPEQGFTQYHENNLEIFEMQKKYPDRFLAFPAIDPDDPDKLERLKQYVAMGAKGLKLYLGHGWSYKDEGITKYVFHRMPLDDPRMEPVYDYCEQIGLPIEYHVNNQRYLDEFIRVLERHPNMVVICPHFMLLSRTDNGSLIKLMQLLDKYPNLYTDISFGRLNVAKPRQGKNIPEGLCRFTEQPELYRALMIKYRDRIMFSADMVFTGGFKTTEWIADMMTGYIHFLEEKEYRHYMLPDTVLNGMYLDDETLEYIYTKNFQRLFPPDKDFRDVTAP